MEIRLLGPLEVRDGEEPIALPRRQQRALVAVLALRGGVVSTDRLIDDLWGASPPRAALGSLQNTVSALRRVLGPERLVTQPPGYRLAVAPGAVDVHRFQALVDAARAADAAESVSLLRQAHDLWRGPPLADLAFEPFAAAEIARLEELRVSSLEERVDADLALGRHGELVAELELLVTEHPLRERLRGQLMVALYRCGRQAEALEVYRAARLALADELGLDPSPELQELERKVLRQDPELTAPAAASTSASAPVPVERRLVTVLAAQPAALEDPEALRRQLDELLGRTQAALARHGGELERFGPEGFVAIFGADAPRDDDAVRAVRAAVELELPAGVATGEVVARAGAVVTRAARLARDGGVLVDARTLELVRDAVAVEPEGDAYRVVNLDATAEGRGRHFDVPLVGRDREVDLLLGAFAAAEAAGRCRVVTVLGEPGIGKTRLARELDARLGRHAEVLVARCLAQGEGATFLPLLDALRRADAERALAGEPEAELVLARLAALAEGADAAPVGESYWAVRRLLEALARARSVLLVLDDAHWAEPALLDLVDYLADRADASLLVLLLARPELERVPGETLVLGPLAPDATRAVVTGTAELPEETRERIVELAEGNALYAEQLAVFAAEGGEGLPPTLEAVLASRLGRIDPAERAVLQRAAVVGREFSRDAVAALAEGEVVRHLLALSRRGLDHAAPAAAAGDDGYTFHHVLLRDAAYGSLTKADRAELHERCAAWLDRDDPGDDVAVGYHLEQAALLRRELGEHADELAAAAGARLGNAGMRSWRSADGAAATSLLARAVHLLPATTRRAELRWELAIALSNFSRRGSDAATALALASDEASRLGDERLQARTSAETARSRLWSGEASLGETAATLTYAIQCLEAHNDHRGLGRALLNLGSVHLFACNLREVEDVAVRAASHYEAAGMTSAACMELLAEALYYGATPVDEAESRCAELIAGARDRQTEANVTAVLGGLLALRGAEEQAHALMASARDTFEDLGHHLSVFAVLAPLEMDAEVARGNLSTAVSIGRASFEALGEYQERAFASTRAVQLADLLLDAGDEREAEAFVDFAEENAIPGDVLVRFLGLSMRARLLARTGDHGAAESAARAAVSVAELTDVLRDRARAHLALSEALEMAGRPTEAAGERDLAIGLLQAKGAHALIPLAKARLT